MIYLDNAATTFPKPEVVYNTMNEVNRGCCVNAGRGSYALARQATSIIDETKLRIANLINLQDASRVILTPSVTIAINQILNGIEWDSRCKIYVSPYEHNAVARTVNYISNRYGVEVIELKIDPKTLQMDIDAIKMQFADKHPTCVCLNHISNVTGYILPVSDIFSEAKKYNSITILDGAQSFGLVDINIKQIEVDFLTFAGHKTLYSSFGVGGFIYNSTITLKEYIVGGTGSDSLNLEMPKGIPFQYESSSPNIIAIASLNAALQWKESVNDMLTHKKELSEYLVCKLEGLSKTILYLPENRDNHIGIVSFNVYGYVANSIGEILDQDFNIAVRTGYHCAPFIHKVLNNQEYRPLDKYEGTVRVSIGYFNTKEEIDALIDAIEELINEMW